ncbi:hypothetical protein KI387_033817, partial [Taxus chinensis]
FGVPKNIVADNASNFSSREVVGFCYEYGITLAHASDYYTQGNGQEESSNKNLVTIIRKLVNENQRMWHKSLYDALWEDRITPKRSLGMSPFQVLYGTDAKLPISAELPALRLARAIEDETFQNSLEKRIMYLAELKEKRVRVVDRITKHQNQVKRLFDKKAKQRNFQ